MFKKCTKTYWKQIFFQENILSFVFNLQWQHAIYYNLLFFQRYKADYILKKIDNFTIYYKTSNIAILDFPRKSFQYVKNLVSNKKILKKKIKERAIIVNLVPKRRGTNFWIEFTFELHNGQRYFVIIIQGTEYMK